MACEEQDAVTVIAFEVAHGRCDGGGAPGAERVVGLNGECAHAADPVRRLKYFDFRAFNVDFDEVDRIQAKLP